MSDPSQSHPLAFISYRRDGGEPFARTLCDHIQANFRDDPAFLDFRSIELGVSWADAIRTNCRKATLILAVIDPQWRESFREKDSQDDWVLKELTYGLEGKIPIVPVLVGGGELPKTEHLPERVQGILDYQAVELHAGKSFDSDVKHILLKHLQKQHGFRPRRSVHWNLIFGGMVALIFGLGVAGAWVDSPRMFVALTLIFVMTVALGALANVFGFLGPRSDNRFLNRGSNLLVAIVLFLLCLTPIALWAGLFLGFPIDLRKYVDPEIVVKTSISQDVFDKKYIPKSLENAFPVEKHDSTVQTDMAKLNQWLKEGAVSGAECTFQDECETIKFSPATFMYTIQPNADKYYEPFDAKLEFPDLKGRGLGRLAEGIAFVSRTDRPPINWQQVEFETADDNMDNPAGGEWLGNKLNRVQLSPGEKLIVILKFVRAANTREACQNLSEEPADTFAAKLTILEEQ